MTERDKELTKQVKWTVDVTYAELEEFADLIRADEREKVLAEFVEGGVLVYDGAVVQEIRARGNT